MLDPAHFPEQFAQAIAEDRPPRRVVLLCAKHEVELVKKGAGAACPETDCEVAVNVAIESVAESEEGG